MSLYNMLFGTNPLAGILMRALDTEPAKVPRFRDCYLTTVDEDDPNSELRIVLYTRTGGGNRPWYENAESRKQADPELYPEDITGPWNDDLRKLEGYVSDKDDDFDSTYAQFYYKVPEPFVKLLNTLEGRGITEEPKARWEKLIAELRATPVGGEPPSGAAKRALVIGEQIMKKISDDLATVKKEFEEEIAKKDNDVG